MREICFDTETTGLDPNNGDRIIEIGCVELVDKIITGNTYNVLINPEKKLSLETIEITHITDKDLVNKPLFKNIVNDFMSFISDSVLIAHNAKFDLSFINYELSLIGKEPIKNKIIDTLEIARKKFPGKSNSLDNLCKRFDIDKKEREKEGHGALLDSQLLSLVYLKLLEVDQLFLKKEANKKNHTVNIEY